MRPLLMVLALPLAGCSLLSGLDEYGVEVAGPVTSTGSGGIGGAGGHGAGGDGGGGAGGGGGSAERCAPARGNVLENPSFEQWSADDENVPVKWADNSAFTHARSPIACHGTWSLGVLAGEFESMIQHELAPDTEFMTGTTAAARVWVRAREGTQPSLRLEVGFQNGDDSEAEDSATELAEEWTLLEAEVVSVAPAERVAFMLDNQFDATLDVLVDGSSLIITPP